MNTIYMQVHPVHPREDQIEQAAELLRRGELVAFPTETVYGLGALASDEAAVARIFTAKGRPPENPLLVHVSDPEQVDQLVTEIPDQARSLMERFWPGPLSLILPARSGVPKIIRAGKPGVGLRMPDHPVALALIRKTGPVAAPSANLYGHPSPLTAEHVRADLDGKIAAVLDAGPTGLGIESTILDLSEGLPRILRRGGIEVEVLQEHLGPEQQILLPGDPAPSTYTGAVKIILAPDMVEAERILAESRGRNLKTGLVNNNIHRCREQQAEKTYFLDLDSKNSHYFAILREAGELGLDVLLFAPIPPDVGGIARSIRDRIIKASSG